MLYGMGGKSGPYLTLSLTVLCFPVCTICNLEVKPTPCMVGYSSMPGHI